MRGRVRVVVHDHAEARQTLQWQLQQWGLACDTADSITAALALTEHQRYEVLLRDRRLPAGTTGAAVARPDGLALLRCIQAQQPSLKLAAMVSGEVAVSSGQPETSDAVAWLAKPVRPMRLRTLLMHALDGADSPRPAGPAP
jgi:CheY-like chemotaxis protein